MNFSTISLTARSPKKLSWKSNESNNKIDNYWTGQIYEMKGLKMAARKTITRSQSPHTYTLWQIRQTQNQWDQAPTCTVIAQQVYLNQLLVLQQQKKTTCDVCNNKVPSKQGEILQREGQILLVEEVHDHPDNNTIGAILVQVFFQLHPPPPLPLQLHKIHYPVDKIP